ncbi:hypothetical protein QQ045_015987 [Rhodiola kirilowii]
MALEGNRPDSRSFGMDNRMLLLKDYLLDDLNSCSANGFKSFPRRHCCTTVRFLVDKDLKTRPAATPSKRGSVHKTAASSAITAFQKASEAVLNAVKLLSVHNRGSSVKSGFLARSLSRKVFKRSFWKKSVDGRKIKDSEIHRWKTFHNLISEFSEKPVPTPTAITTTNSTDENSKSSSWTWSDNEFNSQSSIHDEDSDSVKKLGDRSGEEAGADGAASTSFAAPVDKPKDWMAKDDQKEQFSPVSVLESPFHCEEGDSISSPDFVRVKGTMKKVIQRLGRFETLAKMEPVDLDKMLAVALSDIEDKDSNDTIIDIKAEVAQNMLDLVKLRIHAPSETNPTFCVDNLLLDFFMDSFQEQSADHQLTEAAESYLTGKVKKMVFDWKVEKARNIYIQDMERGRTWKHVDDQRVELGMEIEEGIWNSLVNDLVRELE